MLFNNAGDIILKSRYSLENFDSRGLHILSVNDGGYLVTGFINPPSNQIVDQTEKYAYALKLRPDLSIEWFKVFDRVTENSTEDFDMAESSVEIPGIGYFITGSFTNDATVNNQEVLALVLDHSGNLFWEESFRLDYDITHSHSLGVDAIYDEQSDRIYLLANDEAGYGFFLAEISNVSSSTLVNISQHAIFKLGPDYELFTYRLLESKSNISHLLIGGLYLRSPYTSGAINANESSPFIAEIDKINLTLNKLEFYDVPNLNTNYHDDFFKHWLGVRPNNILSTDILSSYGDYDDERYALINYRKENNYNSLELLLPDFNQLQEIACHDTVVPNKTLDPYVKDANSVFLDLEIANFELNFEEMEYVHAVNEHCLEIKGKNIEEKIKNQLDSGNGYIKINDVPVILKVELNEYNIVIFDLSGKKVAKGVFRKFDSKYFNLRAGVYVVSILGVNETQKIVIK